MQQHRYVPVTVEQLSTVTPERAFNTIAPIDLRRIFKGWGPLPGVVGIDNQPPSWNTPGQIRNPKFSDGTSVVERLIEYTPPHSFAYEISGFTNSLRHLVSKIDGEWTMTPRGGGSLIRWTYAFHPLPGRYWAVRLMLVPLWRKYASKSLTAAVQSAEGL